MTGAPIEIKRVRIIDLPVITRMAYANMTGVDHQFTRLVSNPIGRFMGYLVFPFYFGMTGEGYKAVSEGKIVGCAYLYVNKSNGYIFNVNVNKANRRQGVARRLMNHLEEITKSRKRYLLALQVEDNNLPAKELYRQLGFRVYHPHFLRTDGAVGLRDERASAVSLEPLNRSWGYRYFGRYQALERREGDEWAVKALEDYREKEVDSGDYWRCLLNGVEVGAAWEYQTASSQVLTLALKPAFWADPDQTVLVKQLLDQSGYKRPKIHLHFSSSSHHQAAVSLFTSRGFQEMVQSRLLMIKQIS